MRGGGFRRLHHVSTAYVAGDRTSATGEEVLDCGRSFLNAYERSKFEAELEVARAAASLPATVYRPNIIVGDSPTGRTSRLNGLYEPLLLIAKGMLEILPCGPDTMLDLVPANHVAAAIGTLSLQEGAIGRTFHLTAGRHAVRGHALMECCLPIVNACREVLGPPPIRRPRPVTGEEWRRRRRGARPAAEGDGARAVAFRRVAALAPYAFVPRRFDDSNARAALEPRGVRCRRLRNACPRSSGSRSGPSCGARRQARGPCSSPEGAAVRSAAGSGYPGCARVEEGAAPQAISKEKAMRSETMRVDGIRMRWEERGEGFPVVLVHGIPTSPALWRHVVPRIAGARCLAWEMVGYGGSIPEGRGRDISVGKQAGYLLAWLDHLRIGRAVLAGHDLGGGVVQIAAARRPAVCAGLFLTNAIGYDSWPIPSVKAIRALGGLVKHLPDALLRATLAPLFARGHDDAARRRDSFDLHLANYTRHDGAAALVRQVRALDVRDTLAVAGRLPSLGVPARIVWGAADPFQKVAYGERFARDLEAPLRRIEGGRHFTPEDHPDIVAVEIATLLERVRGDAGRGPDGPA